MTTLDKPTLERSRRELLDRVRQVVDLVDRLHGIGDLEIHEGIDLDADVVGSDHVLLGKVEQAWLFGSVPAGEAGPWSDLDLVLVAQSSRPFVERPLDFPELFEMGMPVDLLVYTAEEFAELESSSGGFWSGFRKSRSRVV